MEAKQWEVIQLDFAAEGGPANPYVGVECHVDFTHDSGRRLRRPGFWVGEDRWAVRFASPLASGRWTWRASSSPALRGLDGRAGDFAAAPNPGAGIFARHGLLRMSPRGLSVVHHDGTPRLLVGDTVWALPWRATVEEARVWAGDRRRKGFNLALLMCVQPDQSPAGPDDRGADEGFARGFRDLPSGHVNELVPGYFDYYDRLVEVLVEHGLVPAHQPLFHGYGWRGGPVAGRVVPPDEYARFCRYLVARYGAHPALWLVGADGYGTEETIPAGGRMIEAWDAYGQPTGIHYNPMSWCAEHQDQPWLDFQWCQTGHDGDHRQDKLGHMIAQRPRKACANGEPTYERIGSPDKAVGWWQGHEAWCNLTAGGTMAVVYGAASLWQWRHHPDEPGDAAWCSALDSGWREALSWEGSHYVGLVGKILAGYDFTDAEVDLDVAFGKRVLHAPGRFLLGYLERGGSFPFVREGLPPCYRIFDPKTGAVVRSGEARLGDHVDCGRGAPAVIVFTPGETAPRQIP